MEDPAGDTESLRVQINHETARIPWRALQRFHAQGRAVWVDRHLDLVEVALRLAGDDADQVRQWMSRAEIDKVSNGQARDWVERDAVLWAVVVKPWVLVQEREPRSGIGDGL